MADKSKALTVNNVSPGSQSLRKATHELYARYRAQSLPRMIAWRKANQRFRRGFNPSYTDINASKLASALESRPQIAQRIQYLTNDELGNLREQRRMIAERLWSMHESDIGDYFETSPTGVEQPKRLQDMSPEIRKNIEKVIIDAKGRAYPQLYSKLAASKELRAMLAIGKSSDQAPALSDAELVAQLSEQAKQLGVEIDLNFRFAQSDPGSASVNTDTADDSAQVIDIPEDSKR